MGVRFFPVIALFGAQKSQRLPQSAAVNKGREFAQQLGDFFFLPGFLAPQSIDFFQRIFDTVLLHGFPLGFLFGFLGGFLIGFVFLEIGRAHV